MRYLIRTENYLTRIILFDWTHTMNIVDPMAIGVETPRINNTCSLDKEFTKLIHINS